MTVIYTNSLDLTTDLLIDRLGSDAIFRLNLDLWRDYRICIDASGLVIENPAGKRVSSRDVAKFYWRRPHKMSRLYPDRVIPEEDRYMEAELFDALGDMVSLLWAEGKVVLVEPMADARVGKLVQLHVAKKYFFVPAFRFVSGTAANLKPGKDVVVKSLTSRRVKEGATLYTTRVREEDLDPLAPWFIQAYIPAEKDVTVVFVYGDVFAFELDRTAFLDRTVDWREMGPEAVTDAWGPHRLPLGLAEGIRRFMDDLHLSYGRLDFLLSGNAYAFLEVNANGEWAWLDFNGHAGLLNRISAEIDPRTPCRPIPVPRHISCGSLR